MTTWNLTETQHHVLICNGSSCMRKGGEEVTLAIREEITNLEMDHKIHTTRTRCNGRCKDACVLVVYPEGVWYKAASPDLAKEIVHDHLVGGKVVEESVIYTYDQQRFAAPEHSKSIVGIDKQKSKI
ncbi:(2Fe-2S) ferredoxin domain-containing protein [Metabacillus bambusae]|uniref:(2Fe-2S) ferredoxin domain-containing protein n=1 Tax=Metabacillus bambusae TaxID=2795218 RepID=A0ABS3MZI1_9BACI|nr:(2Fe-2S) ferredoxin domain-containing protein [Metabacillus bambusae]MBO1511413.1 (2Fe-2S) ferredoxin domain-containing protein [Metabacillus bambusae]